MATILVAPLPLPGHVNPSLRIARSLQAHGHRVLYVSLPEIEDEVRAEGFEFVPLFADALPKGALGELRAAAAKLRGLRMIGFLREQTRRLNQVLQRMIDGEFDAVLTGLRPDLLICDEKLRHLSVIAHGNGVPVLQMNVTIPPELIPREQPAAWAPGRGKAAPGEKLLIALGLLPRLRPSLVELAKKHGYPLQHTGAVPGLDRTLSPELLLCPREFAEVKVRGAPGEYCYIEPCIDLDRREADFPWERQKDDRPKVFFALGTLASSSKHNVKLLQAAFTAAARRPDWQFIISVGTTFEPTAFEATPNVIAVKVAPQLALLKQVTVMVNHGGTNSVKECIYFGVPMVAIPLQYDQPDIGRLVAAHGVGYILPPREVTADTLLAGLDEVIHQRAYRAACEQLQVHFHAAETRLKAAATIDAYLASRQLAAS